MKDDINDFIPSLLNPRTTLKSNDLNCTQASVCSRISLSLRKNGKSGSLTTATSTKAFSELEKRSRRGKENLRDIQIKNQPAGISKCKNLNSGRKNINSQKELDFDNSYSVILQNCSFEKATSANSASILNPEFKKDLNISLKNKSIVVENNDVSKLSSLEFSAISFVNDIDTVIIGDANNNSSPSSFDDFQIIPHESNNQKNIKIDKLVENFLTESSNTEIVSFSDETVLSVDANDVTQIYELTEQSYISVSFKVTNCDNLNLSTKKSNIKNIKIKNEDNNVSCDCMLVESSQISTESESQEEMNTNTTSPRKRSAAVEVNLEIKKTKTSGDNNKDKPKVLILNSDAIDKLSHVIVQPPNFKLKRQSLDKIKFKRKSIRPSVKNKNETVQGSLKQTSLDKFFYKVPEKVDVPLKKHKHELQDGGEEMSKKSGVEANKVRILRSSLTPANNSSPNSSRGFSGQKNESPLRQEIKTSCSDAPRSPSQKQKALSAHLSSKQASIRGLADSIRFPLPTRSASNRTSNNASRTLGAARPVPDYKIVAGTHFAVDAFSYGEIPNVRRYFLTHFHSDHYTGLHRSFNKTLFCSKITADLCMSRLGVSAKYIHVINENETIDVDGIEVTAVDANHCPGAVMLVFTLPNQKTILHTGDFRATPTMESYPVFWNRDVHTVYLDTTYCNPRYDFPTQEQSLDMAMAILRQKKMAIEKAGGRFTTVLIICGTYTIGKEKFFLGISRMVGCSVWACPEKDRVLQTVEGRSFCQQPPHMCQIHVVPMRDLTHEKLRSYLDTLQGSFTEVVAFKPSGWENGKMQAVKKDNVTICGIPYSEHSSFSELVRFVKFLQPKQVVPTVDITGGVKAVQKYFPCPLVYKEDLHCQSKLTDFFSIQDRQQVSAVT